MFYELKVQGRTVELTQSRKAFHKAVEETKALGLPYECFELNPETGNKMKVAW